MEAQQVMLEIDVSFKDGGTVKGLKVALSKVLKGFGEVVGEAIICPEVDEQKVSVMIAIDALRDFFDFIKIIILKAILDDNFSVDSSRYLLRGEKDITVIQN